MPRGLTQAMKPPASQGRGRGGAGRAIEDGARRRHSSPCAQPVPPAIHGPTGLTHMSGASPAWPHHSGPEKLVLSPELGLWAAPRPDSAPRGCLPCPVPTEPGRTRVCPPALMPTTCGSNRSPCHPACCQEGVLLFGDPRARGLRCYVPTPHETEQACGSWLCVWRPRCPGRRCGSSQRHRAQWLPGAQGAGVQSRGCIRSPGLRAS